MPEISSQEKPSRLVLLMGKIKGIFAVALVAVIYIWSARGVDFSLIEIIRELPSFFNLLWDMVPPNWAYFVRLIDPLLETFQTAIAGTVLGTLLAVPLILLASSNVNRNKPLYYVSKGFMNLARTIDPMLYAAILVAGVGLGAFAGMLALTFFSMAINAKLTSESLEAIDDGPLEALEACGGNKLEMIKYAVVPQIMPTFASYTLFVFEINIRASTVLGLVGAGGIGVNLNTSLNLFRYPNAAMVLLTTFVIVVLIDQLSNVLREELV